MAVGVDHNPDRERLGARLSDAIDPVRALEPAAPRQRGGLLSWLRSSTGARGAGRSGPLLSRWFGVLGFICILLTSMATASILSRFMTRTWIKTDEQVLQDFVQSAVSAHKAEPLFAEGVGSEKKFKELEAMFRSVAGRDPVFLAHFYSKSGRIFWSSDPVFVGRVFEKNDELAEAFAGRTVTEFGQAGRPGEDEKPEHALVDPHMALFVETYVPIIGAGGATVGVIELYRTPKHLENAIADSNLLIWASTLLSGLALYLTLGWIVRWGDRRLERSARELAESRGLAAIGEVATAVAHGLRNPLAAMRSSAELALDTAPGAAAGRTQCESELQEQRTALREVVKQVDRLDRWIKALVGCLRTEMLELERCDASELLRECAADVESRTKFAGLSLEVRCADQPLPIEANRGALQQVLDCLIANALEATPKGGSLTLEARASAKGDAAVLEVRDTGPGLDRRVDPFEFFLTTKGSGLGVGLPIARRLALRHRGALTIDSAQGGGAVARLRLPLSSNGES